MMTQTEIAKVRANLVLADVSVSDICGHFGVGRSAVNQVITGEAISERIQNHIAKLIGYRPIGWPLKGAVRPIK